MQFSQLIKMSSSASLATIVATLALTIVQVANGQVNTINQGSFDNQIVFPGQQFQAPFPVGPVPWGPSQPLVQQVQVPVQVPVQAPWQAPFQAPFPAPFQSTFQAPLQPAFQAPLQAQVPFSVPVPFPVGVPFNTPGPFGSSAQLASDGAQSGVTNDPNFFKAGNQNDISGWSLPALGTALGTTQTSSGGTTFANPLLGVLSLQNNQLARGAHPPTKGQVAAAQGNNRPGPN